MEGLVLIEPTELYNLLQQATVFSNLSDNNYLLLIDARNKNEYNESHVVTSKKAPRNKDGQFFVPFDAELECKQNIVVYDSNSSNLNELSIGCAALGFENRPAFTGYREDLKSAATDCGTILWEMGSRNKVFILKGGFEEFSALYPFLRTQKIIFMPKELDEIKPYPTEIIPGFLYLGNWRQGNAPYVQKDLKIKAHINCCVEAETFFPEAGPQLLHIQVEDSSEAELQGKFELACKFIENKRQKKEPVLVFSNLGISRSAAIVIAFMMFYRNCSDQEAFDHVRTCCSDVQPNTAFLEQLHSWSYKSAA